MQDSLPFLFVFLPLSWLAWNILKCQNRPSLRSVSIFVLGDIGRSPRMMYHAQSFAENGFVTTLIGFKGSELIPALAHNPRVQLCYIPKLPRLFNYLPFPLLAPLKITHQISTILLYLLVLNDNTPEFVVVQNPPSIPTLAVVKLVAWIQGSKVIIDWHNLGYSILALKLGNRHIFVQLAEWFEATFGKSAYAHLFVTQAMRNFLVEKWNIKGHQIVLYDRPPKHFHRSSVHEIHELFCKLNPKLISHETFRNFLPKTSAPYSSVITHTISEPPNHVENFAYTDIPVPTLRPDRPALLVSSTSWTPDEDFDVLIDALKAYDVRAGELAADHLNSASTDNRLPKLLVIVTGKGPLKNKYMTQIDKLQQSWKFVRCISLWLEAEDYPILLGSANLGVCLHSSSSALDLPMKIVDMFGCGLPVCALNFACLDELVKNGENGLTFQTNSQLASQLEQLFLSFPHAPLLDSLSASLKELSYKQHIKEKDAAHIWSTWDENWCDLMRPLILDDVNL